VVASIPDDNAGSALVDAEVVKTSGRWTRRALLLMMTRRALLLMMTIWGF
jgi:hypothetical protein